jgi:N-acetylmuramoyl-L-alanine amidase
VRRRCNSGIDFYGYTRLSNSIFATALVGAQPFLHDDQVVSSALRFVLRHASRSIENVGVPRMVMLVSEFRPDSCVVAEVKPSPNHGERARGSKIDMLVLHYTGMRDSKLALDYLCSPASEVSAHYVVMEDGHIVQCVPEARRAWHAGVSTWAGEADINSCSIGIEIANPGHEYGYPDFPRRQIAAVIALCRSIFIRHQIPPDRVLAHSDIAPARKKDPGEKFPWRLLHDSGVGLWVKPAPVTAAGGRIFVLGDRDPEVKTLQLSLRSLGYGIETSGSYDAETMTVIAAFQRHHRPAKIDGIADVSTVATLQALLSAREPRAASWLKPKKL